MNSVLFFALFAAAHLSVTRGLECFNCRYVEGDENEACRLDFEELKVNCSAPELELLGPHYCAKWVGLIDAKEVIVRNCFSNNDNTTATEEQLNPECNFGKDHFYEDGAGTVQLLHAGNLCICEGDRCNASSTLITCASLLSAALIALKLFY